MRARRYLSRVARREIGSLRNRLKADSITKPIVLALIYNANHSVIRKDFGIIPLTYPRLNRRKVVDVRFS